MCDARGCWRGWSSPRCRAQARLLPRPASGLRQARIGQRLVRCSAGVFPTGSCAKLGRALLGVVRPAGSCGQLIPAGVAWTASYRRAGCWGRERGCVDAWMRGGRGGWRGQSVNCRRRRDGETRASEGSACSVCASRDDGCCCQSPWLQPKGDRELEIIRFAEREAAARAGGGGERERENGECGGRRAQIGALQQDGEGRERPGQVGPGLGARRGERKGLGRVLLFLFCSVGSERKREADGSETNHNPQATRRRRRGSEEQRQHQQRAAGCPSGCPVNGPSCSGLPQKSFEKWLR